MGRGRLVRKGCSLGLLLFVWFGCSGLLAQEVETLLWRDSVEVGDSVHLRVRVRAARGAEIFFSEVSPQHEALELLRPPVLDTISEEPDYVLQLGVHFSVYDSGHYVLQRIPILLRYSGMVDTLYSDSLILHVSLVPRDSLLADSAGFGIRPIVGPKDQGVVWAEVWPWLLGVFLFGLLFFGAYYGVRWYRRGRGLVAELVPQRPAIEVALAQLQDLRDREAWRTVGVKYFFTGVTDALRFYIGSVWGIRTLEETTGVIVDQLRRLPDCAPDCAEEIGRSLALADLVKFARHEPTESECIRSVDGAIALVVRIAGEREGGAVSAGCKVPEGVNA